MRRPSSWRAALQASVRRPVETAGRHLAVAVLAVGIVALGLAAVDVGAAQALEDPGGGVGGMEVLVEAVVSGGFTLVVAGLLVAVSPEYCDRTTARIRRNPIGSFAVGFGISLLLLVLAVVLVVSVVGIVLLLFLVPVVVVLLVVGELGLLAVGRTVADGWGPALVVAVAVGVIVGGVPLLGGLMGFVLSCMGIGAAYAEYSDDGARTRSTPDRSPVRARGRADRPPARNADPADRRPDQPRDRSRSDSGDDPGAPR